MKIKFAGIRGEKKTAGSLVSKLKCGFWLRGFTRGHAYASDIYTLCVSGADEIKGWGGEFARVMGSETDKEERDRD